MKYVTCEDFDQDKHPEFKSWDGKRVKQVQVNIPDRYAIYEFLDSLPEKEKQEIFEYNLPSIYFVDIETEIVDGFPDAETAPTRVLALSIVYEDKIILLGLKDLSEEVQERIKINTNKYFEKFKANYKFKYIKYEDEFDMLYAFFYKMVPKMPLITGWNFVNYDWLYLVNRSRKLSKWVNGKEYKIDPAISSLTKRLNKIWSTNYEMPAHRMIFDYMQLYEICDTTIKVKESSSLDFVSGKLVGVDKIKYLQSIFKLKEDATIEGIQFKKGDICRKDGDELFLSYGSNKLVLNQSKFANYKSLFNEVNVSSLQRLYEEDFEYYMYYNAVDSVLVQKIHDAKNYISIIYAISALSQIRIVDVISQMNNALGSLAITEGVLRNRFREFDSIVLFRDENKSNGEGDKIAGGWVKDPVVGMNQWCVTYDFASLYPTTQRQFYIAPETFIGIQNPEKLDYCDNGRKIEQDKHVVCVNGVVFEKRLSPTLKMLEDVYADRKKSKKIMMNKKDDLKKVQDEIKKLEKELAIEI